MLPKISASTSLLREMLQGITWASPPALRMPSAAASQASALRLEITTLAPSLASEIERGGLHFHSLNFVIPGCAHRSRVYPTSALSMSKSATADLDAQARNPYARWWLWIPGLR